MTDVHVVDAMPKTCWECGEKLGRRALRGKSKTAQAKRLMALGLIITAIWLPLIVGGGFAVLIMFELRLRGLGFLAYMAGLFAVGMAPGGVLVKQSQRLALALHYQCGKCGSKRSVTIPR